MTPSEGGSTIQVWSSRNRTAKAEHQQTQAPKKTNAERTPGRDSENRRPRRGSKRGRTKGLRNPQHHPCVVLPPGRERRAETPRTARAHRGAMFRPGHGEPSPIGPRTPHGGLSGGPRGHLGAPGPRYPRAGIFCLREGATEQIVDAQKTKRGPRQDGKSAVVLGIFYHPEQRRHW